MRLSEIDILIIPGWMNAGPDHWQSRWLRNMKSARRVEQADWDRSAIGDWVDAIVSAVAAGRRPAVIVAHGCGVTAVAAAAPRLAKTSLAETSPAKTRSAGTRVAGAFLVAVPDLDPAVHGIWPARNGGFAPLPMQPLPFPAKLIGSSTDPYCTVERTQEIGRAWGADVSIIANAGHLNAESGHGPWPEGLLSLGLFLKGLG